MTAVQAELTSGPLLVTPTAVLVYDGPAHALEWYDARRGGITATDIVKILGFSDYGDATSVWADKRATDPDDGMSEAARWGLILEDPVARRWAEVHGTSVDPVGVLAHVDRRHHRASLDRLVRVCPDGDGPCGLQVKCRSAFKAGSWREEVPDDVYVQEQWEMHVAGYRHMHVAVLFGGNSPRWLRVDRDDPDVAALVADADRVWRDVQTGTPPMVEPSERHLRVLEALYPDREGSAAITESTARALIANWVDAKAELTVANAAAKRAKNAVKAAEAAMVEALGAAEAAYVDGHPEPAFAYFQRIRPVAARVDRWHEIKVPRAWTTSEGASK